ncbi:MAG: hypothetical protein ACR2NV_10410 [Thermoleophilaceae bacterium]
MSALLLPSGSDGFVSEAASARFTPRWPSSTASTTTLAKWLHLDDLKKASQLAGYTEIEVAEVRAERKVRTVLLFARPMSHLPMGRGR